MHIPVNTQLYVHSIWLMSTHLLHFQKHPDQQQLTMHATDWKACLTCARARMRSPKLPYWTRLRHLRRSHLEDGFQDSKTKANRIGRFSQAVSYQIGSVKPALSVQAVWWTGATDKHLSRVEVSSIWFTSDGSRKQTWWKRGRVSTTRFVLTTSHLPHFPLSWFYIR